MLHKLMQGGLTVLAMTANLRIPAVQAALSRLHICYKAMLLLLQVWCRDAVAAVLITTCKTTATFLEVGPV